MTGSLKARMPQPVVSGPAVALRIADFLIRTEVERMSLLRLHLQATVVRESPLLLDLAAMEGISLADAVALIQPPQDWPWNPLYEPPAAVWYFRQRKTFLGTKRRDDVARFRRAFVNPGVVIREADHPRGRFAIRPCGAVLGFTAGVGSCVLSAFGPSAMLKLPEPLPETLIASIPGRLVGAIFDHPAFAGKNYVIRRVEPDLGDGMPVFTFRAPLIPLSMAWPLRIGSLPAPSS